MPRCPGAHKEIPLPEARTAATSAFPFTTNTTSGCRHGVDPCSHRGEIGPSSEPVVSHLDSRMQERRSPHLVQKSNLTVSLRWERMGEETSLKKIRSLFGDIASKFYHMRVHGVANNYPGIDVCYHTTNQSALLCATDNCACLLQSDRVATLAGTTFAAWYDQTIPPSRPRPRPRSRSDNSPMYVAALSRRTKGRPVATLRRLIKPSTGLPAGQTETGRRHTGLGSADRDSLNNASLSAKRTHNTRLCRVMDIAVLVP